MLVVVVWAAAWIITGEWVFMWAWLLSIAVIFTLELIRGRIES
jgi:hypothetical protein